MIEKAGSQHTTGNIYQNSHLMETEYGKIPLSEDRVTLGGHSDREMPGIIKPLNIEKSKEVKPKGGKIKKLVASLMLGLTFFGGITLSSSPALAEGTGMEPTQVEETVETKETYGEPVQVEEKVETKESHSKNSDYKFDLNSGMSSVDSEVKEGEVKTGKTTMFAKQTDVEKTTFGGTGSPFGKTTKKEVGYEQKMTPNTTSRRTLEQTEENGVVTGNKMTSETEQKIGDKANVTIGNTVETKGSAFGEQETDSNMNVGVGYQVTHGTKLNLKSDRDVSASGDTSYTQTGSIQQEIGKKTNVEFSTKHKTTEGSDTTGYGMKMDRYVTSNLKVEISGNTESSQAGDDSNTIIGSAKNDMGKFGKVGGKFGVKEDGAGKTDIMGVSYEKDLDFWNTSLYGSFEQHTGSEMVKKGEIGVKKGLGKGDLSLSYMQEINKLQDDGRTNQGAFLKYSINF